MGLLGGNFDPDRARELATLAESDPGAAAEHVDEVAEMLGADRDDIRNAAAYTLSLAADPRPRQVATVTEALRGVLDDGSSEVRANATWCLSRIAIEYPDEVYPALPDLETRLRDTATEEAAISAFVGLSDEYPAECSPVAEDAIRLLEHREASARSAAAYVTWNLGKESPELVRRAVDPCLELLTDDTEAVRHNAVGSLGQVATGVPEAVEPGTDRIAELLEDPVQSVRTYAAWALSNLAVEYPERVATAGSDELTRLLTAQGIDVRRYATYAVVGAAVQTPSAVTPTDRAIAGLEAVRSARVLDIDDEMLDEAIAALESSPSVDTPPSATRQQEDRRTRAMTDAVEQQVTRLPGETTESNSDDSGTGGSGPATTDTQSGASSATDANAGTTSEGDRASDSPAGGSDNDPTEVFSPSESDDEVGSSSSQFCPHCGGELPPESGSFCGHCGSELP